VDAQLVIPHRLAGKPEQANNTPYNSNAKGIEKV
jgi:hypothetical protein